VDGGKNKRLSLFVGRTVKKEVTFEQTLTTIHYSTRTYLKVYYKRICYGRIFKILKRKFIRTSRRDYS